MALTISFSKGDVAIRHDLRVNAEQNVDRSLTSRNEIMVDKLKEFDYDLSRYTDARFKQYIDEYNKGKYLCRQITEGYSAYLEEKNRHLMESPGKTRNPTPMVLEFVAQVGNRDTNSASKDADEADIELNREYFREFIEKFKERYKHVELLLVSYHADEPDGTPHLHMLTQFVGEGYAKGLSHQVSISRALECDGFERGGSRRTGYSLSRWAKDVEDNLMEPLLKDIFHEEREILNENRSHDDTPVFRAKAKEEDRYIQQERKVLQKERDDMQKEREDHQKALDDMGKEKDDLAADISYFQLKTDAAEKAYNNTRDDLRTMSEALVDINGQLSDKDQELKTKNESSRRLDAELADKRSESTSLDKEIADKKDQKDAFDRLDAICKRIDIIGGKMYKAKEGGDKAPDDMIIKRVQPTKSFGGKIKTPESVVISAKDFDALKSRYNEYSLMTGVYKKLKELLKEIIQGLKQLVAGKESQERIMAEAKASDIIKEKDDEMKNLREEYDDLLEERNKTETVLQTEHQAEKERLEPDTWDEYIRIQYTRGDCIPERTLDDMFRDMEWYRDNDKESFKDMMKMVSEFKDDVIDRSLEQAENDMLQERLRLMEEAREKMKHRKKNRTHEKSYDGMDDIIK